jgi:hypothetical protein
MTVPTRRNDAHAGAVVLLLVAGIVLHLLHANVGNGVVSAIYDADNWLATPFANVFSIKDADTEIAVTLGLGGPGLRDRRLADRGPAASRRRPA